MPTVDELFKAGHDVIRRRQWNPFGRAKLTRIPTPTGDMVGPWVEVTDMGLEPETPFVKKIGIWQLPEDNEYEAWDPKPWPWEKE
jgi:hypothetical protein